MPSISSYFNPVSKEHHGLEKFEKLKPGKKFLTVVLTALATLISLPIAGLGGVAVFRALTRKFTVIKLKSKGAFESNILIKQKDLPSIEKTATKTEYSYFKAMSKFYGEKKLNVIDDKNHDLFKNEKDAFFVLFAEQLKFSTEKIMNDMKEFIAENPEKIELAYKNLQLQNKEIFTCDTFKDLLLEKDVHQSLIDKYGEQKISMASTGIEKCVTMMRLEILSQIFDVKIVLHDVFMGHTVNFFLGTYEDYPGMTIMEVDPRVYGNGENELEIVHGNVLRSDVLGGSSSEKKVESFYIQPRLMKKIG